MRRLFAVVAIATSSAIACGLFPDLGTLEDGGAGDGTLFDATSDVADAGVDAAPAAPFCSTVDAAFCCSFDDTSPFACSMQITNNGGIVTLTDASAFSPPFSLLSTATDASSNANNTGTYVWHPVNVGAYSLVTFDFKLQLVAMGDQRAKLAYVETPCGQECRMSVQITPSGNGTTGVLGVEEYVAATPDGGGSPYVQHQVSVVNANVWYRVRIVLDFNASTWALYLNGGLVGANAFTRAGWSGGSPVGVAVGWGYTPGPSAARAAYFDDMYVFVQ